MKKQLITLILLSFSLIVNAQKTDTVLFRGALKIIIENNESSESNFKAVGQLLVDSDYGIEKKDTEFGQMISSSFRIKDVSGTFILMFNIKPNKITMYAQRNSNNSVRLISFLDSKSSYKPVTYRKNGIVPPAIFEKMEKFSKAIPNIKITYSE